MKLTWNDGSSRVIVYSGELITRTEIRDANNNFYVMTANGGNSATAKTNWTLPSGTSVTAMVYDNTGQTLYVTNSSGMIYGCSNLAGGACTQVGQAALSSGVSGLSIVTSLSSW